MSDDEKNAGIRNTYLKALRDIKKIINKKNIDWKKVDVSINKFEQRKLYSLISTPYKAIEDLEQEGKIENYILIGKIVSQDKTSIGGHKLLYFEDLDLCIFINYENLNEYIGKTVLVVGTLKDYYYKQIEIDSLEKIEILKIDFNSALNLLKDPLTQQIISLIKEKWFIDLELIDIDFIIDQFIADEPAFKNNKEMLKNRLNTLINNKFIEKTSHFMNREEWVMHINPTNKYYEMLNIKQTNLK